MSIFPYLNFNGNCREAFDLYADIFSADKTAISTYGDAPPSPDFSLPDTTKDLVLHAELVIHGSKIMLSDAPPGSTITAGENISLALVLDNIADIEHAFARLRDEGGTVLKELQETFWTKCYGGVKDRFGVPWYFNLADDAD